MAAGLSEARGRALIFMDADLQHPPSLIARMVELLGRGLRRGERRQGDAGAREPPFTG